MGKLNDLIEPCRKVLLRAAIKTQKINYGELAGELGLANPRQKWSHILDPIYEEE